jgi:hypothetical protein
MRLLVALILLAAWAASPAAAAAPKQDIRGVAIGMTPEQVQGAFGDCKHRDPANVWQSVRESSGGWVGRSVMTCRLPGEPDSALAVTFTSTLTGKVACKIDYRFYSARTTDGLVADVMAQFGVGKTDPHDTVYRWSLTGQLTLRLSTYMQLKTLSLANDTLCERDRQAVADYRSAQQNIAPAPTF